MNYTLTIKTDKKEFKRLVEKHQDVHELLGEYFFILHDRYGIGRGTIEALCKQFSELNPGDVVDVVHSSEKEKEKITS